MTEHVRNLRRLVTAACLLGSAAATAWTPYGQGPPAPGYPSQGMPPDFESPSAADPGLAPAAPAPGYAPPYGQAPRPPYGVYPSPGGQGFGPGARLPGFPGYGPEYAAPRGTASRGISRQMTEDAYLIDIPLHGASADQLQIDAEGNWLRITRDSSRQETREDSFDDGRGFARRYSFSSGRTSRRVGLPMDADLDAMTREETESGLRLRIPRRR